MDSSQRLSAALGHMHTCVGQSSAQGRPLWQHFVARACGRVIVYDRCHCAGVLPKAGPTFASVELCLQRPGQGRRHGLRARRLSGAQRTRGCSGGHGASAGGPTGSASSTEASRHKAGLLRLCAPFSRCPGALEVWRPPGGRLSGSQCTGAAWSREGVTKRRCEGTAEFVAWRAGCHGENRRENPAGRSPLRISHARKQCVLWYKKKAGKLPRKFHRGFPFQYWGWF